MKVLFIATFTSFVAAVAPSRFPPCQTPTRQQDINWNVLGNKNFTWYDNANLNIKIGAAPFDCTDWMNFTAVDDGVLTVLNLWMKSGVKRQPLTTHMLRVEGKTGIYVKNKKYQQHHLEAGSAAIAHQADEEAIKKLHNVNKLSHEQEFFFLTDYENYFTMVTCFKSGEWKAWVKSPNVRITDDGLARAWIAARKHGLKGNWIIRQTCEERKPTDFTPK